MASSVTKGLIDDLAAALPGLTPGVLGMIYQVLAYSNRSFSRTRAHSKREKGGWGNKKRISYIPNVMHNPILNDYVRLYDLDPIRKVVATPDGNCDVAS